MNMKASVEAQLNLLIERYPALDVCRESIAAAYEALEKCYLEGGKLLICGNGGSAADSEHIVGELMKGFCKSRPVDGALAAELLKADAELGAVLAKNLQGALPAIALTGHPALSTAYQNDMVPELSFAQQLNGLGAAGDVLLAISTSGGSRNVLYAAVAAKAKGLCVIGLTGSRPSRLAELSDVCIRVPETETYRIQEYHLPVYHCLCLMLEARFFDE